MTMKITQARSRWIGALFLGAILAYGTGSILTTSLLGADYPLAAVAASTTQFAIGALLMFANSVIVAAIGILFFPVLSRLSPTVALAYVSARLVESIVLIVGIVSLLSLVPISALVRTDAASAPTLEALGIVALSSSGVAYQLAMAALGLGSIFLCVVLYRSRLIPRVLAAVGLLGYTVFLVGAVLEVLGHTGVGLPLSILGGLFEVAVGVWLLARGFNFGALATNPVAFHAVAPDAKSAVGA